MTHAALHPAGQGPPLDPDIRTKLIQRLQGGLPGHLGLSLIDVRYGFLSMQMEIASHHLAANGYLHAGSIVTLADTCCGFGCVAALPEGAINFTTIELKSNFLRTATEGTLYAEAWLVHPGRRTQVWDATVYRMEDGVRGGSADEMAGETNRRPLALFRCTQMILYPDG
jgi:1,4-dihydroxy-2-naphthoyl-CoA hydrolase